MSFYAFKLTQVDVKHPRSPGTDNDIVTFSVLVNQTERGGGGGFFPALAAGSAVPAPAVRADTRRGVMTSDWIVGPMDIAPGDVVSVIYSGTNTSDSQLDFSKQSQIEVRILDSILSAAVGAVGGIVGAAIGAVLGLLGDPVATILGFHPPVACNGLVFSDAVAFSGDSLTRLPYGPPQLLQGFLATLPLAEEASFTKSYTDEATHDKSCGDLAQTDVTMSVLRVPHVSVRDQDRRLFEKNLSHGLRQLAQDPRSEISLKRLMKLIP